MGLFGSKNEINIRLSQGTIKSCVGKSFFGGSNLMTTIEGDTITLGASARGLSGSLSKQLEDAVGYDLSSAFGSGAASISVTRYGLATVELVIGSSFPEKGRIFPSIISSLENMGYTNCYASEPTNDRCGTLSISTEVSPSNLANDLTKFLNAVAVCAVRPLTRV